jgi:hypothetical protein
LGQIFKRLKISLLVWMTLVAIQRPVYAGSAAYRVSENGHYLLGPEGEPFFWQGDTEWESFYLLTAEDAKHLLRERRAQGLPSCGAGCAA